jgi:hypothetical protein
MKLKKEGRKFWFEGIQRVQREMRLKNGKEKLKKRIERGRGLEGWRMEGLD